MRFTVNVFGRIRNFKLLGFVASKYFHIMTHKVRAISGTHNKQTFNFYMSSLTWIFQNELNNYYRKDNCPRSALFDLPFVLC